MTDLNAYCTFVESLRYKVLIYFCAGYLAEIAYWYESILHIVTTPPYKGVVNCYLIFLWMICTCIAYLLNIYVTRSWYFVCAGHLAERDYCY